MRLALREYAGGIFMDLRTSPSRLFGGGSSSPANVKRRRIVIAVAALLGVAAIVAFAVEGSDDFPGKAVRTTPTKEPGTGSFPAFDAVTVTSQFSLAGEGKNIDTIAFWEAPDATNSRMFVSSKDLSLVEVWRYPFSSAADELPALTHSCLQAAADSATNGVLVDQESDLLYVASNRSPRVCVFTLPALTFRRAITSGVTYGQEPNLALLNLSDGSKRLYVSDDDEVYVHDAATGRKLAQFTPTKGLETMWGDSFDEVLYIPDENDRTGVHAYDPDGSTYERDGQSIFGDDPFDADAEGILEYTCPATGGRDEGTGLIVVSDQIDSSSDGNDYEVFDRRTWRHLGNIKLRSPGGTEYVHNTDGIGSTQQASPEYPDGLFTAINDDSAVAGIGWGKIFDAISAETGRAFGCG
jgi:myo-inositol-hexaphosphate 3-phosphohydrolase